MPVKLLFNPVAGGGHGKKRFKRIVELLEAQGLQFDYQLTQFPGHARQLAQEAVNAGYERIIVCGGDGILNEAVNGVKGSKSGLGIIPCGRGNDWARQLGISTDLKEACHTVVQGKLKQVDVAQIGERYFCSVAGIGLAAEVNKLANENSGARKNAAYLRALWQMLPRIKPYRLKIEHDEGVYEGEMLMVAVGNSSYFGGGLQITPRAVVDDGLLDICIVEVVGKLRFLRSFPAVYKGRHLRYGYVKYIRSAKVRISGDVPLDVFADGEFMQQLPVTIMVHSLALNFIVP